MWCIQCISGNGLISLSYEDVIFTSESSVIYWVVGLFQVNFVVFLNVFEKVICNSVILCKCTICVHGGFGLDTACNGSPSSPGHQLLLPHMIKSKSTTSIPSLSHIPRPGKTTLCIPLLPVSPCLHEHLGSLRMVRPIKPLYLYQLTSCLHAGLQAFTAYVLQAFCFAQSRDHLWLRLMCFAFGSEQRSSVAKAYVFCIWLRAGIFCG